MGASVGGRLSVHLEAFFFFFLSEACESKKIGWGGGSLAM